MRTFSIISLLLVGCDQWGATGDPACAARVVAAQVTISDEVPQPWAGVQVAGKGECPASVLQDVEVLLFHAEGHDLLGKATLESYAPLPDDPDGGHCAVYRWPTAASATKAGAVVALPPKGVSAGVDLAVVPSYEPGSALPAFLDLDTNTWHLWSFPGVVPGCRPPQY